MLLTHRLRLAAILLGVLLLISAAVVLGLHKTVTLNINGEPRQVTSYALTVGSLLHSLGIPLSPLDSLSPAQEEWLRNRSQITLVRAIPIQVLADGKLVNLYRADRIPTTILANSGITLHPGDEVLSNDKPINADSPFPVNSSAISLQIIRSINIQLNLNEEQLEFSSTAPSLGSALWSQGYRLYAADIMTPTEDTSLMPGLKALVHRSHPLTVITQDAKVSFRSSAATVAGALEDAHLSLQGLDYSLPSPGEPVPVDGKIRLVQVTEQVLVEQTPLPFETQYQADAEIEAGTQSVIQKGEYGLSAQRVRIRYEDGQEVARSVESQWVARQPVPRILGYGTMVVMHTTVVDGITIDYWRTMELYATSYHPSEVGDTTASGLPLKKGVAAVDRSLIPFYTQLYIPGYGEAVAADTGGGVIGRMIDLGYSDNDYVPWHQWVTVYFLWPPPDNINWQVP